MSNPGVGFQYPAVPVTWLKRDVLLFANSIGATADELHFLYELHPKFQVFPTYPIILPFKKDTAEVTDFYAGQRAVPIPDVPKFDARRVVDGQRHIKVFKQLPTSSEGRKFEIRQTVTGVWDKGKPGSVVDTRSDIVDATNGEIYASIDSSSFFVGQGGWGGPKGPSNPAFPPPKGKAPDATFSDQTDANTALLYRLNGDYNPLHADPEPGKKMGFGDKTIIHGLYSWNTTAHGLLKAFGGSDAANFKEYQCRFASPVIPGAKVVTNAWKTGKVDKDGFEEIIFESKIEGGKVCLSNGRALIRPASKAKL